MRYSPSVSTPSDSECYMIDVERLTIGWGVTPLLENLEFTVADGEVFAILGGSGSGKSTLLRHLIGLEQPMGGTIRISAGAPAGAEGGPSAGVLFQSGGLLGSMRLAQNVPLPLEKWTDLDAYATDLIVSR